MSQSLCRRIWIHSISDGVPRRSLLAAAVVGTILNLINQDDALVGSAPLNVSKMILTFIVPYFLSTYGAVCYCLNAAGHAEDAQSTSRDAAMNIADKIGNQETVSDERCASPDMGMCK